MVIGARTTVSNGTPDFCRTGNFHHHCPNTTNIIRATRSVMIQPYLQCRTKSTVTTPTTDDSETLSDSTITTDTSNDVLISPDTVPWNYQRHFIRPGGQELSPRRNVPSHIVKPLYATTGDTISSTSSMSHRHSQHHPTHPNIPIYTGPADAAFINHMRQAGQIAATTLRIACDCAQRLVPKSPTSVGTEGHHINSITTDDIDALVHNTLTEQFQSYPSPLHYATFPKSVCTSVNEIICHGIPEVRRPLSYGDVVSIDVSCYTRDYVHGDNCATIIVGDYNDYTINGNTSTSADPTATVTPTSSPSLSHCDWRNVPFRNQFATEKCYDHFRTARRLMQATHEALMTAISIVRPNASYISDIGRACQTVADRYGYSSVSKYRGHGIGSEFHVAPFIKHYYDPDEEAHEEPILVREGMIFTIEPMFCQYDSDCAEWDHDHWTVTTLDGGLSCQFEHTVYVTKTGVEILTLPLGHSMIGRDWV